MNLPDIKLRERILLGEEYNEKLNSVTSKLKKLQRLSKQYVQTAHSLNSISHQITKAIEDLTSEFTIQIGKTDLLTKTITKIDNTHNFVAKQISFIFDSPMNTYLEEDLKYSYEIQKTMQQLKIDYDQTHYRYYSNLFEGVKPKEELSLELLNLEQECARLFKEYNSRINNSLELSQYDFFDKLCSYMHLLYNSNQQSFTTISKAIPEVDKIVGELKLVKDEYTQMHSAIPDHVDRNLSEAIDTRNRLGSEKQGYLLMRKKISSIWKLVWVRVRDGTLTCSKRWKSFEEIVVVELTLAALKVEKNDKNESIFKIISPKVEVEFKASNEVELQSWKSAIEQGIKKGLKSADTYQQPNQSNNSSPTSQSALSSMAIRTNSNNRKLEINSSTVTNNMVINNLVHSSALVQSPSINNFHSNSSSNIPLHSASPQKRERLTRITSQYWKSSVLNSDRNSVCADCSDIDPEWASLNLGILLCHQCSGVHRSMGVHISKVKSLYLDRWSQSQLKILELIGNERSNAFWENMLKSVKTVHKKPNKYSSPVQRQKYIEAKYIQKLFIRTSPFSPIFFGSLFYKAIKKEDLMQIVQIIAYGGDVNIVHKQKPIIHWAIMRKSAVSLEFLSQQNCDLNIVDCNNLTALDQAIVMNDEALVAMLEAIGAKTFEELKKSKTDDNNVHSPNSQSNNSNNNHHQNNNNNNNNHNNNNNNNCDNIVITSQKSGILSSQTKVVPKALEKQNTEPIRPKKSFKFTIELKPDSDTRSDVDKVRDIIMTYNEQCKQTPKLQNENSSELSPSLETENTKLDIKIEGNDIIIVNDETVISSSEKGSNPLDTHENGDLNGLLSDNSKEITNSNTDSVPRTEEEELIIPNENSETEVRDTLLSDKKDEDVEKEFNITNSESPDFSHHNELVNETKIDEQHEEIIHSTIGESSNHHNHEDIVRDESSTDISTFNELRDELIKSNSVDMTTPRESYSCSDFYASDEGDDRDYYDDDFDDDDGEDEDEEEEATPTRKSSAVSNIISAVNSIDKEYGSNSPVNDIVTIKNEIIEDVVLEDTINTTIDVNAGSSSITSNVEERSLSRDDVMRVEEISKSSSDPNIINSNSKNSNQSNEQIAEAGEGDPDPPKHRSSKKTVDDKKEKKRRAYGESKNNKKKSGSSGALETRKKKKKSVKMQDTPSQRSSQNLQLFINMEDVRSNTENTEKAKICTRKRTDELSSPEDIHTKKTS